MIANCLLLLTPSGLQNLGLLEELNLRRNRIRSLAGLEAVPSLQKLYMSNNEIQGLGSLAQLHHLARLQTLQMEADMQPVFDCTRRKHVLW